MIVDRRFWRHVSLGGGPGACWSWHGPNNGVGYGMYNHAKPPVLAHRASYAAFVGPIPYGLDLDHLCRNRACIRPDHLEPVTHRENCLRGDGMASANAAKTACPHGHDYTESNTILEADGSRKCRTCKNAGARRYKARKRVRSGH